MKLKEALEIVGGLSNPSKMPCHSYGISAHLCITGAKLVNIEGSVCGDCYALKGMYGDWNKNVSNAHAKRAEAINLASTSRMFLRKLTGNSGHWSLLV